MLATIHPQVTAEVVDLLLTGVAVIVVGVFVRAAIGVWWGTR